MPSAIMSASLCFQPSLLPCRGRRRSCARAAVSGSPSVERPQEVEKLLRLVEGTERGLRTGAEDKAAILECVEKLATSRAGRQTTAAEDISATWRLLWTTEKETLFILRNAGWFGTKAGDVYQVIDVGGGLLSNVITFPPSGAFVVLSSLEPEGLQRLNFRFTAAKLSLPSRTLSLPPYGKGWFDTVYLDSRVRVAKDIRGDTLVVARDGPPRSFL